MQERLLLEAPGMLANFFPLSVSEKLARDAEEGRLTMILLLSLSGSDGRLGGSGSRSTF